jgi:hypothetical protein
MPLVVAASHQRAARSDTDGELVDDVPVWGDRRVLAPLVTVEEVFFDRPSSGTVRGVEVRILEAGWGSTRLGDQKRTSTDRHARPPTEPKERN